MPKPVAARLRIGVCAALLTASLVGCGPSPAGRLAQARRLIDQHEQKAALIVLKSVIQDKPALAEARFLLGGVLLAGGDAASAEIELRRALELGLPVAQVAPPLARALLALGQPQKLVALASPLTLPDAAGQADLKTSLAQAQTMLGDATAARASLGLALQAVPQHAPALLLEARLRAIAGDVPAGLQQIDALLGRNPKNADAWLLKGDLLARSAADPVVVMAAYREALAQRADLPAAHAALIATLLARRETDVAYRQWQAMQKALPKHPQTAFYEGQLAFVRGDLARARELFQGLLRSAPDNMMLLQSAGAVELQLKAPAQAELLLSKALGVEPASVATRRLLARSQLALGQAAKALAVLEPLLGPSSTDTDAITLAAQARLLGGDAKASAALFEQAARIKPEDPKLRTALALSLLSRGQTDSAIAELQSVAASDSGVTADLALISAELRRKSFGGAQKAIDVLERKQPGKPLAAQLRGQVLLMQQDRAGARAAFEQAVLRDPAYYPPVAALAGLDLLDKQPARALARFEALLKVNPRNGAARLAVAELATRSGATREAVAALLDDAIKANPADNAARLALIEHHLATHNPQAALVAAQAGLAQQPDQPELLHALGRAQLAAAEYQQAIITYKRLVGLQAQSAPAYRGLAEAQMGAQDLAGASRSVRQALLLVPDDVAARRLAIKLALRQRQPAQALVLARELQKLQPKLATGLVLEGEIEQAQKNWEAALPPLRKALALVDPEQAPERLHYALSRAGRVAEAEAFATAWQRDHPQDALFRYYLGDIAVAQKDFARAELHYRAVLQIKPEHALSLNNVAWLLLTQKKPGALPLAQRAVAAAPNMPALMDTLALAYAAEQQVDKAIALQKRSLAMRPEDPFMRLNLARFYIQAGEKRLAKAELDRLDALGERFARQAEVASLRKSLGGR